MSLLEARRLAVSYGASQALFDVSLALDEGEVLALMGRNGMGKSTTVKATCRMVPGTPRITSTPTPTKRRGSSLSMSR